MALAAVETPPACQTKGIGCTNSPTAPGVQNADDALIVEGYGVHAPHFAGITMYATQVTTKALQAAKRTEQGAASVTEG